MAPGSVKNIPSAVLEPDALKIVMFGGLRVKKKQKGQKVLFYSLGAFFYFGIALVGKSVRNDAECTRWRLGSSKNQKGQKGHKVTKEKRALKVLWVLSFGFGLFVEKEREKPCRLNVESSEMVPYRGES